MEIRIHESGIKIFDDFIHPDDITEEFLQKYGLNANNVFLVSGQPYRVQNCEIDGSLYAAEIKSIGLTEWVLSGNQHPAVKWQDTYALYCANNLDTNYEHITLVPYQGKTYFCRQSSGEILSSIDGECFEYFENSEKTGWTSWSDTFKD